MADWKYYLFKVAQSFALPLGLIILALFLSSLFAKRYRKFFMTFGIIAYLLTTKLVGNFLIMTLEKPYMQTNLTQKADAVVVLGGGYFENSPNLPLEPDAFKRLIYGIKLANQKNLPLIYNGATPEVASAKQSLDELKDSIKLPKLIMIDKALSTRDNAKLTKNYLDKQGIKNPKLLLVTSAYHISRALKDFEYKGLKVIPAPTDFKSSMQLCWCYFIPSPDGIRLTQIAIREYLAKIVIKLKSFY